MSIAHGNDTSRRVAKVLAPNERTEPNERKSACGRAARTRTATILAEFLKDRASSHRIYDVRGHSSEILRSRATPNGEQVLVIGDTASMVAWRRSLYVPKPRSLPPVSFQLPELSSEQNQTLSARVRRYAQACGCTLGSVFMSAALMISALVYFRSGRHVTDIGLRQALFLLAIAVFSALTGKLVGLAWARWRLIRIASRLHDLVVSLRDQAGIAT